MKFLIAFAILSAVVYGRFFIRARRVRAYNLQTRREDLMAEREALRISVRNAFVRYESTRERLYSTLDVPYVQGIYLQPHAREMLEARDKAAADPDLWTVRMAIDMHEVADREYPELCAEWDAKNPGVLVD